MSGGKSDPWSPERYDRFRARRRQAFDDLIALVEPAARMSVVDLGCGTGDLTHVLHDGLQAAATVGIDSSAAMLERSREHAGVSFREQDIESYAPKTPHDLVFSNSALHWIPGHERLFERLASWVGADGQLAVQMPSNDDRPTHQTALEVAAEEPFASALDGFRRSQFVLSPEAYAGFLDALGFERQHVRLQVYGHHLPARESVLDWVEGTTLTPFEQRLPPDLWEQFLARYREKLFTRIPDTRPLFFPYKRLLIWARR